MTPTQIRAKLAEMTHRNQALTQALTDRIFLTDYVSLVREGNIWTDALQKALNEHEIIVIPASDTPYMIDNTVTIPSNRRIEAHGATIRLCKDVRVLMLRNEHTQDGTHMPISKENRDTNITIVGGSWEESATARIDVGLSGLYDLKKSFFGVSTCMLFNNMDHLTIKDLNFCHTASFAIQIGDITDVHCENIEFIACFADGLHVNGNTENLLARNLRGYTDDDLVALNMYDWQMASINFGPMKTVLCENLTSTGGCRALRILPGLYQYDDGNVVDCSLTDAILSRLEGIHEFKLYLQTPPYPVSGKPEKGGIGSIDNLFFEHIRAIFNPQSSFWVAPFEINSNINRLFMEDISVETPDRAPLSSLIKVGPKSARVGNVETFDPYLSSDVDLISLKNIRINGIQPENIVPYIEEIVFGPLYEDGPSTARGTVGKIEYQCVEE